MIKVNEEDLKEELKKRIKCNETLNNILNEVMEELDLEEEEALEQMLLAYYDRLRSVGVNVVRRGLNE